MKHILPAYEGKQQVEDFEALALGSTIGGMSIHTAGVTIVHGMEHPASGLRNIVHGEGLAALSPVIYKETIKGSEACFASLARFMGGKDEKDFLPIMTHLLGQLELQVSLSDLGISKEDIPWMTENCLKVSMPSIQSHPRIFTEREISDLYEKALSI